MIKRGRDLKESVRGSYLALAVCNCFKESSQKSAINDGHGQEGEAALGLIKFIIIHYLGKASLCLDFCVVELSAHWITPCV